MRSFKPALARDYDVFFAAIGLLCGGILFFQGWRLDPILQFGQFLLAGTTIFFAYESVRLRGVTTEQARRSSYFDDEEPAAPFRPRGGLGGGRSWDDEPDRFDEPEPLRRRIPSREEPEDDFYRPRRPSRAAIPERAASRRDRTRDLGFAPTGAAPRPVGAGSSPRGRFRPGGRPIQRRRQQPLPARRFRCPPPRTGQWPGIPPGHPPGGQRRHHASLQPPRWGRPRRPFSGPGGPGCRSRCDPPGSSHGHADPPEGPQRRFR